ncbi:D-glycero-beta-D-manno-heptose-7-phosphate kinase [Candidatus Riflebacteria bacterium]
MERNRLKELLIQFKKQNILVIGDLMLDRYIWGRVERISPEAPVPIVLVNKEEIVCGGACNVAANIARLGARASMVGFLGNDFYGRQLDAELKKISICTDGIIVEPGRQTTVKSRIIGNNQQIARIDREEIEPRGLEMEHKLMSRIESIIKKNNITGIVISDYAKGAISGPVLDYVIRLARKSSIFVSVDPKLKNFHLYKDVGIITPNHAETSQTLGIYLDSEDKFLEAGRTLLKRHKSEAILITRGANGMQLFEKSGRIQHIPTKARKVFDVTGAGDSVIATFALTKACNSTFVEAAEVSNFAAGYVVGILGTATCNPENLLEFFDECTKSTALS